MGTSSISAPARFRLAGTSFMPSTAVASSGRGAVAHQRFVDRRALRGRGLEPDAAGQVALRVDVDQQHRSIGQREGRREIDGGRGLSDASLLIGDGKDLSHRRLWRGSADRSPGSPTRIDWAPRTVKARKRPKRRLDRRLRSVPRGTFRAARQRGRALRRMTSRLRSVSTSGSSASIDSVGIDGGGSPPRARETAPAGRPA